MIAVGNAAHQPVALHGAVDAGDGAEHGRQASGRPGISRDGDDARITGGRAGAGEQDQRHGNGQ